ncbi:MAG: hypothetical protein KGJ63_03090 [Pseudomonadota bacterium]|nr:hypothetical protein [Xanthomonadaceae bacterium]MDE3071701.1 hypothetical protein [Pseudomonadota bacterium]
MARQQGADAEQPKRNIPLQLQAPNRAAKIERRYGKANGWLEEKPLC